MSLETTLAAVQSPEDLAALVERLADDLANNPEGWENADLQRYLEALAAWLRDHHSDRSQERKQATEVPSWRSFGAALLAARIYE